MLVGERKAKPVKVMMKGKWNNESGWSGQRRGEKRVKPKEGWRGRWRKWKRVVWTLKFGRKCK